MMKAIWETIDKSVEWVVLVVVVSLVVFMRAALLPLWERIMTACISAGLAFAFTDSVAEWLGGQQLAATVLIMLIGPAVLNAMLTIGEDREFLNNLLKAWARKKLGVTDERNDL